MKSFLQFLLFVLVITLALGGLYGWKSGVFEERGKPAPGAAEHVLPDVKPPVSRTAVPGLAALDAEFERVAAAVIPSVVSITARKAQQADPRQELLRQFFGIDAAPPAETAPLGSGAIVSAEGHIVTNLHVVDGAREILVSLSDGRRLPAALLGADTVSDIAVLKIGAKDLIPLAFADSEKVRVGQIVFAVGNPFGLQETVTQGIISARERLFSSETLNEFFQTDAAINPGNSGGPLVNIRGELVGINNFIFSQSGGSQGIGFSIPANTVRRVLDQILQHGRVLRPYLGVVLQPLDAALSAQLGLPDAKGALVEAVLSGSPAASAGILPGDVITRYNDRDVRDFNDLRKKVAETKVDSEVTIDVLRGGRKVAVDARIVEQSGARRAMAQPGSGVRAQPSVPGANHALSGLLVGEITPAVIRRYGLPENISGVVVQKIAPGSPAEAVLQPGDAIEQINDMAVAGPADFYTAAEALVPGEKAMLLISRGAVRSFEVIGR